MRIISGICKGRRLKPPRGAKIRPTSDRVKEAVFSVVQFDLPGSFVLDLFSGSGQLGIEALSRGASRCVFVDCDPDAVGLTKENIAAAGLTGRCDVVLSDAEIWLKRGEAAGFGVAFVDPPYESGMYGRVLPLLPPLMSEGGKVVCEHARTAVLPESRYGMNAVKTYRYGQTSITLYEKTSQTAAPTRD
jgi:16S rRNA (guanine(966)-N(2))-methyltransferase RsmD